MTTYSIAEISPVIHGQVTGNENWLFRYLTTDTRKITFPAETIFFALVTERRNGHRFIADAYAQGVRIFVVSENVATDFQDATFIVVHDTLQALQQLAAWHRSKFSCPVIGITGSNGKTIVKEWLFELLENELNIVRSPKSFNSQLGVPLSVWMLHKQAALGIFEAGISQPGEMEKLAAILQPTMGIFTMLGDAHNEGFQSVQQKLAEKFTLFNSCTHLICHTDDELVRKQAATFKGTLLNWGNHEGAWLQWTKKEVLKNTTIVSVLNGRFSFELALPFTDDASIENAMHCVVYLLFLGIDPAVINQRMVNLKHLDMRLQWKKAIHHCYLLNDSYSNDFTSLVQAIEYLHQQSRNVKRTIILSDLSVPAGEEEQWYERLAMLLKQKGISRLIGVGANMRKYALKLDGAGIEVFTFDATEQLLQSFGSISFDHEDILLKGGRAFELERIAALLEAQQHQTVLEIHLSALAHNLKYYRSLLQPQAKMMVMVKAFGYGSGDAEIARTMQFNGVDYLAVAYVDEGVALRQAGVHLPVLVLNTDPSAFDAMEQNNLEPEIYSFDFLHTLLQWCRQKGLRNMPVHLKIDTGMHRLGFLPEEIAALGVLLAGQDEVMVKSVFTHLVASEDATMDDFTAQQLQLFAQACAQLEQQLGYGFVRHAANTAAITRHPEAHADLVRLGVGLYGGNEALLPVMKLVTTVAQVKTVQAGQTVGYGKTGLLHRDSVIATVRIGYADGYPRSLSNGNGFMLVRGQRAPVVGKVCMDMTMLDVTDIEGVQSGDRVEVFGDHISIQEVAHWSQTITYEIMTGISQRVKRVYIEE